MTTAERVARIVAVIRRIPPGSVASYGQVAEIAGIPRGARQVAYALRQLPDGHDVPWFRVVQSAGTIAFPPDTPSFADQRDRLRREGVVVTGARIDMRRYRWQPGCDADLDYYLWGPSDAPDTG
ncbi:MAG TPA: MGMT family protein [Woeseiaceae bacterium]|nr:MGMT family protein [Woeseiaceae bacterium]